MSLDHLRGQPIVLYGLGAGTQQLLSNRDGLNIVGLMDRPDGGNVGTTKWGQPILSPRDALNRAKAIVITARPLYVPIIHRRIRGLGVPVYDAAGNPIIQMPERIASHYDLGYYAYGAITLAVLQWLAREAKGHMVLFGSRDGYLFDKLDGGWGTYFLTSRRVLSGDKDCLDGYSAYVKAFSIPQSGPLYFFDLISSGTIASKLPSVLGRDVTCLCVVMTAPPKVGDYRSLLGTVNLHDQFPHFYRAHYISEAIFTAPHGEVAYFDPKGNPIYCHYQDSHTNWDKVSRVHDGIIGYVDQWHKVSMNPQWADATLGIALERVAPSLKEGWLMSDHYTGVPEFNPWDTI